MLEAHARFSELQEMEKWKAQNCRTCPHCRRVIQRLSGCDHMVCGADAESGRRTQNGCGRKFNWSAAPVYKASAVLEHYKSLAADGIDAKRLTEGHVLAEGAPVLCDSCGVEVVGVLHRCLNCACVHMCLSCTGKVVRGEEVVLRNGLKHPRSHVFRALRAGQHVDKIDVANVDNAVRRGGIAGGSSKEKRLSSPQPALQLLDGSYDCLICMESVRRSDALRCSQCTANPWHLACAISSKSFQ